MSRYCRQPLSEDMLWWSNFYLGAVLFDVLNGRSSRAAAEQTQINKQRTEKHGKHSWLMEERGFKSPSCFLVVLWKYSFINAENRFSLLWANHSAVCVLSHPGRATWCSRVHLSESRDSGCPVWTAFKMPDCTVSGWYVVLEITVSEWWTWPPSLLFQPLVSSHDVCF